MKTFSCFVLFIFISILYQISSGAPNINKMAAALESKTVDQKSNCIVSCTLKILSPLEQEGKNKRKIFTQRRTKRSIGSVKIQGFLKPKEDDDSYNTAPPSFVALVFIDIIAGIFTLHALAALLYLVATL